VSDVQLLDFRGRGNRRDVSQIQPVAGMTAAAADWSERDLDRRFNLGPPRDELTALSATLDGLLARIAASVRHEQRFSAEMAHELRTPLAGLRGETELALRRRDLAPHVRESFEAILRSAERTLSEKDIAGVRAKILKALEREFQATLR